MKKFVRNIHYNQKSQSEFTKTLDQRIRDHFKNINSNIKANSFMWLKVTFFILAYFTNWFFLAFTAHGPEVTLILLLSFIVLTISMAFTVAHDAAHRTLSKNKFINDLIFGFTFNLLGPNAYLWKIRHTNAHHLFVNIPGSDVDIESTNLLRISPHTQWFPYQRYQHLYAPILYSIFTLHWIFVKDFKLFFMRTFGNITDLNHGTLRFLELIFFKFLYVSYMILIPTWFLPYSFSTILLTFIAFHLVLSFFLLLFFASSHVSTASHFVDADKNHLVPHSFYEHQLLTSVDFHPENPLFSFFCGGFNSHVAHHMFPQICSIHYPSLTKIIKKTAKEFGLKYEEKNLLLIWKEHFKILKMMGGDPKTGNQFFIKPPEESPLL